MKKTTLLAAFIFVTCHVFGQNSSDSVLLLADTGRHQNDSTEMYGFIPQLPIKVGGGPADQRKYLESLLDAQGKKVSYERLGSCCQYPSSSPKALFGDAILDKYEISYRDSNNKKQKVTVYISFYDYETPEAIKGFTLKD